MRLRRRKAKAESKKALEAAIKHVEQAKARNQEVREISVTSRRIRTENHFQEQLIEIMRQRRGGPHES